MLEQHVFIPPDEGQQIRQHRRRQKAQQVDQTDQQRVGVSRVVQPQQNEVAYQRRDCQQPQQSHSHPLPEVAAESPEIGPKNAAAPVQSQIIYRLVQGYQRRPHGHHRQTAYYTYHIQHCQIRHPGEDLKDRVVQIKQIFHAVHPLSGAAPCRRRPPSSGFLDKV